VRNSKSGKSSKVLEWLERGKPQEVKVEGVSGLNLRREIFGEYVKGFICGMPNIVEKTNIGLDRNSMLECTQQLQMRGKHHEPAKGSAFSRTFASLVRGSYFCEIASSGLEYFSCLAIR